MRFQQDPGAESSEKGRQGEGEGESRGKGIKDTRGASASGVRRTASDAAHRSYFPFTPIAFS